MFPALLAMQAAGMVVDYLGTKNQIEMGRIGSQLEQASIEANLSSARLEAEDNSLQAMIKLRQNLGSQIALQAARGTSSATGSALLFREGSVSNFNADERMRRMNLLGNEARLKAGMVISKLHQSSSEAELWSGFRNRAFNTLSSDLSTYGFGSGGSAAKSAGTGAGNKAFGTLRALGG